MTRSPLALAILLCATTLCVPAASDWEDVGGGAVRIVVEPAGEDGTLRGALDIRLAPGWKTYWRDPGDSGVPPTVEASAGGADVPVEIGFPAPQRHDDGYSIWAGYDHSIAFPLTLDAVPPGEPVTFSVFLGICETICVPVQAELTVEIAGGWQTDAAVVEAAFTALPADASPGFGVGQVTRQGEELVVEVAVPDGTRQADLFVAASESYFFAQPQQGKVNDALVFRVPILSAPEDWSPEEVHYTLSADDAAVSGTFTVGG